MRHAIGDVLPLAIAAAISPFPIIGVVLMLVTPRARRNSLMFVIGWLAGLGVVGAIGLAFLGAAGASNNGTPSTGANTFQIVLGALLLLFALRQWRKRPRAGEEPELPKWMSAVDRFSPLQAATLGVGLSAVNPKNLILTLAAATSIAATNLPGTDQAVAFVSYAVIATLGVAAPVVVYFTMGKRAAGVLDDLKVWLGHNNAAIMAVIFAVIGGKVLGQGIAG
ncbi:MAG TPA: GAP family protein [Acidimicrobiia bacterium]|jgi:hypothetical protein